MDKIVWSDEFLTGTESIDDQHFEIVTHINQLIDYYNNSLSSRNVTDLCDELLGLAYNHFDFEETLLQALNYNKIEFKQHREVHKVFSDVSTKLVIKSLGRNDEKLNFEIIQFLKDWWIDHILNEDMKFKLFLEENIK